MSKRYQAYTRLKLDYPWKHVIRITFDRPETYNSVDPETHTQLTTYGSTSTPLSSAL